MKFNNIISFSFMAALCAGCATSNKVAVHDPVGPPPFEQAKLASEGTLQVYSAQEKELRHLVASDVIEKEETRYESAHTDYAIYQANGDLLKEVRNAQNRNDPKPALVNLPTGQYKVIAEAQTSDGWTMSYEVPVVIKAGQKTVVHLEADWRPAKADQGKYSLVRGHDSRILGWQAEK